MDLIIHHLGHIFHNMSEISIDFAKPPGERALLVHPRPNMEPRAVLSTAAMTIPMVPKLLYFSFKDVIIIFVN